MASSTSSSSASSRFALRRETHFGERVVRCYADRPRSVLEMFERARQRGPHREALVFEDRRFSWQDLHDHSARLAHALAAQGVGPGDRVVLLLNLGGDRLGGERRELRSEGHHDSCGSLVVWSHLAPPRLISKIRKDDSGDSKGI
jgi:non-ribosomal peptide synthetase component F